MLSGQNRGRRHGQDIEAPFLTQGFRLSHSDWSAQLEFRTTGPDHGGGNLQLWYTKIGLSKIGKSSIYTVGQFDGLVLVIDPYGGQVELE